jgi:hypothetical protein
VLLRKESQRRSDITQNVRSSQLNGLIPLKKSLVSDISLRRIINANTVVSVGCTRAWYCSLKCHKRGWSQHKLICGKINNWRSEPLLVDSDIYHDWKELAKDKDHLILTELNGNLITFCVDSITDEVFDGFTDRPVRIKRGEEKNEAGGNDRCLQRADL